MQVVIKSGIYFWDLEFQIWKKTCVICISMLLQYKSTIRWIVNLFQAWCFIQVYCFINWSNNEPCLHCMWWNASRFIWWTMFGNRHPIIGSRHMQIWCRFSHVSNTCLKCSWYKIIFQLKTELSCNETQSRRSQLIVKDSLFNLVQG